MLVVVVGLMVVVVEIENWREEGQATDYILPIPHKFSDKYTTMSPQMSTLV